MEKFTLNETSYFGRGTRKILPEEIKKRKFKKALVVTDDNLFKIGVTNKITDILDANDIGFETFHDINQNVEKQNVIDGLSLMKSSKADFIIAVGGGACIDCSKAISLLANNSDKKLEDLDGNSKTQKRGFPIIAIPTTAGSASETTINFSIIDSDKKLQIICIDENDIPIISIIDSELMDSMPIDVAASNGMDAMCHGIEGYISRYSNEMSEMFSLKAIKLLNDNLDDDINYEDKDALDKVALGEYIAGMGTSNVGTGLVHAMANSISTIYNLPHGEVCAILLPIVMEFNGEVSVEKFRIILDEAFNIDSEDFTKEEVIRTFCEKINNLSYEIGITKTLRDLGVKTEDFETLAEMTLKNPFKSSNPRDVNKEQIMWLYQKAW